MILKGQSINFFSTTGKRGLYKFLIESSALHASNLFKKKINYEYLKCKNPSLRFWITFIRLIISGSIFREKEYVKFKYSNIDVGLYAVSSALRHANSHKSQFFYFINLLRYIFIGGSIIDSTKKILHKVDAVYIDHAIYIHSIYFKLFADHKKIIYTNQYPRGLFYIDFKKKNSKISISTDAIRLSKNIWFQNYKNISKKKILKIIFNPNLIPWCKSTNYKSSLILKKKVKDLDYIIYAHSFLDGNLSYGYDGFINIEEWLEFTIKSLKKKNSRVIVKGHPNFYNEDFGQIANTDKIIFEKFRKKYESKKIIFINEPIKNIDLLKLISKKTILITHHGTATIEGALLGFKCISSSSTFWDNEIRITNKWSNRLQYKKILGKNWGKLRHSNKKDLSIFLNQLYSENAHFGQKFWHRFLEKHIKSKSSLVLHQHAREIDNKKIPIILDQIKKNIIEINYKKEKLSY
tara:strand:+ start:131 stop:1522 length:1392 start_codon:yes stop_codon:yes gene_type:complete